jgi:hypothetical protein
MSDFKRDSKIRLVMSLSMASASLAITTLLWLVGALRPGSFIPTFIKTAFVLGIAFAAILSVWWLAKHGVPKAPRLSDGLMGLVSSRSQERAEGDDSSRTKRIGRFLASLLMAFFLGNWSYQLHWTAQQSFALHQFSAQARAPLVPIACKDKRGIVGEDFIVASARAYREKIVHKEACWYRLDRFLDLFPNEASKGVGAIIQDHYRRMSFRVREFNSKPPSRWILLGIPLAFFIALLGFFVMVFGPLRPPVKEREIEPEPAVDPGTLAEELARLRRNLRS